MAAARLVQAALVMVETAETAVPVGGAHLLPAVRVMAQVAATAATVAQEVRH